MKFLLSLALLAPLFVEAADFSDAPVKPKQFVIQGDSSNVTVRTDVITQFLDHFRPTEPRTWEQRYFEVSEYYNGEGPIFLLLAGQSPADPNLLLDSFIGYLTKEFGALCFLLEHRFYGDSQPLSDLSTENLVYMSTDQALADVAYFILERSSSGRLKRSDAKWIVFGEEHAGSLAAWARLKYPHLVHAAVVDSAPILAYPDFPEYFVAAELLFDVHSKACVDHLSQALQKVYSSLWSIAGQTKLTSIFKFCRPINDSKNEPTADDVASLYFAFLHWISHVALCPETGPNIQESCAIMLDDKGNLPMEKRLARILELVLEADGQTCLSLWSYKDRVQILRNISLENRFAGRQKQYQQCTEFGWFPDSTQGPFNSSEDALSMRFFNKLCSDVYEFSYPLKLEYGITRTNTVFGGTEIANVMSNAVFVYGEDDPWSSFRPLETDNPGVCIDIIPGVGKRVLRFPPSEDDAPKVLEVKKKVLNLVSEWIVK